MRRSMIISAMTFGLTFGSLGASPAWAVPGSGAGQSTFPMVCDGEPVTLTIGGGAWSAAYVQGTGSRFVPKSARLLVIDAATGAILFESLDAKPSAGRKAPTVCTDTVTDDGIVIIFEVRGKLT